MTTPIDKVSDAITEEAADWFHVLRESTVSASTRTEFAEWLLRSPQHTNEYLRLAELWDDLGDMSEECRIDTQALVDAAAGAGNLTPLFEGTATKVPGGRHTHRRGPRWPAALAAGLAILAGFIWFVVIQNDASQTYATQLAEQRSFSLNDGSVVHLNTDSEILVHFDDSERRVELLRGEVLFNVATDEARPFVVQGDNFMARVLGTRFNVYRRARGTLVTVIEGKVEVSSRQEKPSASLASARAPDEPAASGASRIELRAGEQTEVRAHDDPLKSARVDVQRVTAWTNRRLVFRKDALSDVVAEFNRYNQTKLHIADDALAETRIDGIFNADDPRSLIDTLHRLSDIEEVRRPDGTVLLQLRPAAPRGE